MKLRYLAGDLIGIACIFLMGYFFLTAGSVLQEPDVVDVVPVTVSP